MTNDTESNEPIGGDKPATPEDCDNARPHPGGQMPASFYRFDMSDDEWYGGRD